jgi:hypothetical protein
MLINQSINYENPSKNYLIKVNIFLLNGKNIFKFMRKYLINYRNKKIIFVEIGIFQGGSLRHMEKLFWKTF